MVPDRRAWTNEDTIRIQLNPFVQIPVEANQKITLFKNKTPKNAKR